MAFVDTFLGEPFMNVTQRVGKTGTFDDFLFVQIMLKFLFTEDPTLKRFNPVKGEISVTGQPVKDTPLLIAAFQKHFLKRAKPEGFINRAGGSDTQKRRFTILQLNLRCESVLVAQHSSIKNILELLAFLSPFAPSRVLEPRVISKF